jgi:hypothetical protein
MKNIVFTRSQHTNIRNNASTVKPHYSNTLYPPPILKLKGDSSEMTVVRILRVK